MLDFKPISLDDRNDIEKYFNFLEEPFCDFSFGNLFFWSVVENTNIAFYGYFLFIRFSYDENFYYTFPIGNGEIKNAINLILEYAKLNNKKIKFVCLNKNQTKILKENFEEEIIINKKRDAFDYTTHLQTLCILVNYFHLFLHK